MPIINIITIFSLFYKASKKLGKTPRYGDKQAYELGLSEHYHFILSSSNLLYIPILLLFSSTVYFLITKRLPFNTNKILIIILFQYT